jgi:pimeloyl-ACP methyl ester carboxylesterase
LALLNWPESLRPADRTARNGLQGSFPKFKEWEQIMTKQRKPTIVFCHGIWADGSCFSKVIPALQADGHEVIAVQYGLDSFEEDVATVKRTLNRVGSPVILVGHSYGGATITAAGVDERVVGLVFVAAVAPDAGETVQNQLDKYPSDIFSRVEVADGRAWMLPNGTEFFCGDLSAEDQKLVWATHYAPVFDLFHQQKLDANSIGWKSKPSWYVLATKDHTVHPDLQRWVSKRMGANVRVVESSHVPMLSKPDVVIEVIRKAAAASMEKFSTTSAGALA